ncbi:MAG: hypothetical protein IT535_01610 [Bauldia sp.]|nr:hypothetical protein [Bauldia sp.]
MADYAIPERADYPALAPLAGVRTRLAEARRRARLDLLAEGIVWSAVVGLGVACAALLFARFGGSVGSAGPLALAALAGSTAFALAAAAAVRRAVLFPPSLASLARRADSVFGLDERLSTAIELDRKAGGAGWVRTLGAAAIAEAGEQAALVDPRRLAPLRAPRLLWAVPALVLALAVMALAPIRQEAGTAGGIVASEPTLAQRQEIAANLREIAQTIRQDLASRPDGYRTAIARTLEASAENYAAGSATHGELAQQLGALLDHARRLDSAEGVAPAASADVPRLIEAALSAHLEQLARPPSPSTDGRVPEAGAAAEGPPQPGDGEGNAPDSGEVNAMNAGPPREASATGYAAAIPDASDYDEGVFTPPPNFSEQQYQLQQFAGVPVGGAANAGKGEGDAAGQGVMPLAGEALAGMDAFGREETVALPLESGDSGRRIRIEVEPQAMPSAAGVAPAAPGTWRYVAAEAVSRQALGPEDRAIVSRYFGPGADTP